MNVGNVRKVAILFLAQILTTGSRMRIVDFVALGAKGFKQLGHPGPDLSRQRASKLPFTAYSDRRCPTIGKVVIWQFSGSYLLFTASKKSIVFEPYSI